MLRCGILARWALEVFNLADTRGPAIVQADLTILLEVDHPDYESARDALAAFAELVFEQDGLNYYLSTNVHIVAPPATQQSAP